MWLFALILFSFSFGIDLKNAVESALEYSPSIKALREEQKSFEGKALTYRSFLNPSLSVSFGNFGTSKEGFNKNPLYGISYSQPILLYPLSRLSKEATEKEKEAFGLQIEREKNQLKAEVYRSFYDALYKKELLKIAQENLKLSEELYHFIKRLYELGETTKLELFRAERELQTAKTELELARVDYQNALRTLSSFVGKEVQEVEGRIEELRNLEPLNPEDTPQVRYYQLATDSVRKNVELEKLYAKPQVSIELLGEKVADKEYGYRVFVSTTLPFFYRREGEIIQLLAQANSLKYQRERELINTRSQYEAIRERYNTLRREFEKTERELLPRAQEELSLAIKSYKLRTITLLELSDTKRRYLELLKYRAELLMKAHEEFSKYLSLGGKL
jgi:cobalt-zinc-cadmium efflux system outer membrane protein